MTNDSMKKTLIKTSIFTLVSITLMLHRAATKHIMITDAAGVSIDRGSTEDTYNLLVDKRVKKSQAGKLTIPLSKSVSSDNIAVEDNYVDHELLIYIDGREAGFYLDNAVITDLDIIESAVCMTENDTGAVCLDFKLDGLYANESALTESGTLEVSFFKPYEKYDRIVVIDPAESYTLGEKDVVLDVATEIRAVADADKTEENNIRFYYTRLSEKEADLDKKIALLNDTRADMLISIGALGGDGASGDGIATEYNDSYYLRGLNNGLLADILEKNVVSKASADARGMFSTSEDDELLKSSRIPSSRVLVGVRNSETDQKLLQDGSYRNKIATGIYQGIVEAYEHIE